MYYFTYIILLLDNRTPELQSQLFLSNLFSCFFSIFSNSLTLNRALLSASALNSFMSKLVMYFLLEKRC